MDIFFHNLHDQATEKSLRKFLTPILNHLSIFVFQCQKLRGRGCATITVLDVDKGAKFLELYGSKDAPPKLRLLGRPVHCSLGKHQPNEFLLRTLEKEEADRVSKNLAVSRKRSTSRDDGKKERLQRKFGVRHISCGQWSYDGHNLAFEVHTSNSPPGVASFGPKALTIKFGLLGVAPKNRLEISYASIESITTGSAHVPTVTLSLSEAPRMFKEENDPNLNSEDPLVSLLYSKLRLNSRVVKGRRIRTTNLDCFTQDIVARCFIYRLFLVDSADVQRIYALRKAPDVPPIISWTTAVHQPKQTVSEQVSALQVALSLTYRDFPFNLKFQIQKIAQNGYLSVRRVLDLLPTIYQMVNHSGSEIAVAAVRKFSRHIPFPGPETQANQLTCRTLIDLLNSIEEQLIRDGLAFDEYATNSKAGALVYKATVTPTGTFLYGPDYEGNNRVLRRYAANSDSFLRVSFLEEDGEPLRFDRDVSNEEIFHQRFKGVLQGSIEIAGRQYAFLGFSHSSLRAQTCWFMAPFVFEGELLFSAAVIGRLGDFSRIRSPAKCAARIGQAFSDTFNAIRLPSDVAVSIPDVEAHERCFSDGVGTISPNLLQRIHQGSKNKSYPRPTLFQIRYKGAKGMLSLDNRLTGETMCLRSSMVKFEGSDSNDLELCGAAKNPLSMYLNRQLVKILEDLGIGENIFVELQTKAVDQLRMAVSSAYNAAHFLERNSVGIGARVPYLLKELYHLRLSFQADEFLRDLVEIAVLQQLRELKHRSRIPVEKGVTLYGIMDETGYLKEGEIYCVWQRAEESKVVLTGRVSITRCPALHPGDVQLVQAVDVPPESPLNAIHNCVVFSQHGKRDLPSMLSGGDLDGDLYNIIYHEELIPKPEVISPPADYPRLPPLDIGRRVERQDMANFFLQFMENDQLGRIATLHQILADQSPRGTFDGDCLTLADMHSTAVDFSKTGIPVNISRLPKYPPFRPDFLATGPRADIVSGVTLEDLWAEQEATLSDPEDEDQAGQGPKFKYYESRKILGKLYRAIDEREFLKSLQRQAANASEDTRGAQGVLQGVWQHVLKETALIQWRHHVEWARDVRETYEDNLIDTIYQYSTHPSHPLQELEVFAGVIIGKTGAQSKRQKEYSKGMREKFEEDVVFTVE
ncbi:MAG: hypothetical protein M1835_004106, partial [Candelina submexicana]